MENLLGLGYGYGRMEIRNLYVWMYTPDYNVVGELWFFWLRMFRSKFSFPLPITTARPRMLSPFYSHFGSLPLPPRVVHLILFLFRGVLLVCWFGLAMLLLHLPISTHSKLRLLTDSLVYCCSWWVVIWVFCFYFYPSNNVATLLIEKVFAPASISKLDVMMRTMVMWGRRWCSLLFPFVFKATSFVKVLLLLLSLCFPLWSLVSFEKLTV